MALFRASGVPRLIVPLAALLLVAACGSAPAPATGATGSAGPAATADGAATLAARALLGAATLDDERSLGALEGIRFSAAGVEAARVALAGGATGGELWAATYVYATSGTDTAPLAAIVANTNASTSVRAMAAAGLVGRGDVAGFEPLIAGLAGSEPMDGAEPAGKLWEFAADVLGRFTSTGFGPLLEATDAERATIQAQWQAWLSANRASLRFDGATQLWVLG
jgi:hypothetical protein